MSNSALISYLNQIARSMKAIITVGPTQHSLLIRQVQRRIVLNHMNWKLQQIRKGV